jgi:hypothetical protein
MIRLFDHWLRSAISTAAGILRPVPGKTSNLVYPDHRMAFIRAAKDRVPPRELPEVGEITAFRCWKLSCGYLWSIAAAHRWEPDEPMSGDLGDVFFAEGAVFGGVYAWRQPEDAVRHARRMWRRHWLDLPPRAEALVIGRVALWGEIDEHERGYRAENARVSGLDAIISDRPFPAMWFATLEERYRVEHTPNRF